MLYKRTRDHKRVHNQNNFQLNSNAWSKIGIMNQAILCLLGLAAMFVMCCKYISSCFFKETFFQYFRRV
jgi:hypothetical protein